ncbi:LegC family aminotransferase [Hydrogenimonas urashimensis]|uniref:LegC family aminotransferase n=1 Tax=Hydrogenimonas urashimensis TaxID=2740515 RepID=UPI0019161850|nr:LegC family aminotransferase [Hydrogenimonas urashimensis]
MKLRETIDFIRSLYGKEAFIPLHAPVFAGNEKIYLQECIDSTFVSSVGRFVDRFEAMVAEFTGAAYAIATVNGTAALHVALKLVGVDEGSEVITQPLTFVATCNAISYCRARPVFVDVDKDTLGMSPDSLEAFLQKHAMVQGGVCINKTTGRRISAVVPMHTFGHPCRIDRIAELCERYAIPFVEDAAESLGSYFKGRHTGTYGRVGVFSFNGNKTITTGGGGMLVTDDEALAARAKHITTTAKIPHSYEYIHDEIGYNYRLPNLNAALGCAQMERLEEMLENKRATATAYRHYFEGVNDITFVEEPVDARSNYWLNAIILDSREERDRFLMESNGAGVMVRPIWRLMNRLTIYETCQSMPLDNALWLEERVVNIPSGVRL